MKSLVFLIILFILTSCSTDKDTYWCGDHPCINKKEKEAYFKKTMIVEIKDLKKKTPKSNSEIEKIIQQARKGEKKRTKEEKTMAKQGKSEAKRKRREEKNMAKQEKLEAKRIKKEEKNLLKQTKLEAKRKKKEEKSSAKQIEMDQAIIIKKKEKTSKQSVDIDAGNETLTSSLTNFDKLLEKITRRNISRPYPDINDIQE